MSTLPRPGYVEELWSGEPVFVAGVGAEGAIYFVGGTLAVPGGNNVIKLDCATQTFTDLGQTGSLIWQGPVATADGNLVAVEVTSDYSQPQILQINTATDSFNIFNPPGWNDSILGGNQLYQGIVTPDDVVYWFPWIDGGNAVRFIPATSVHEVVELPLALAEPVDFGTLLTGRLLDDGYFYAPLRTGRRLLKFDTITGASELLDTGRPDEPGYEYDSTRILGQDGPYLYLEWTRDETGFDLIRYDTITGEFVVDTSFEGFVTLFDSSILRAGDSLVFMPGGRNSPDFGGSTVTTVSCGEPPVASFVVTSVGNLTFEFDASASTDSDGTITTYEWDFGDGGTSASVTAEHTYAGAGRYGQRRVH
jgi:hypothetical protein